MIKEDFMYSTNRWMATVYSLFPEKQEILRANQARVGRLFKESHIAADDWKRWKSMAEG